MMTEVEKVWWCGVPGYKGFRVVEVKRFNRESSTSRINEHRKRKRKRACRVAGREGRR